MRFQRSCLMTICLERRHWSDVTQQTLACVYTFLKVFKKSLMHLNHSTDTRTGYSFIMVELGFISERAYIRSVACFWDNSLQNSISCVADNFIQRLISHRHHTLLKNKNNQRIWVDGSLRFSRLIWFSYCVANICLDSYKLVQECCRLC